MGRAAKRKKETKLLKLDLGCGPNPREGFEGVDSLDFGQKHVVDLTEPWPWPDNSVEEAHSSHFIEHLDARERVHFFNELYRVLVHGGKCLIIVPHWASNRAYGDPTHKWPPVSEMAMFYVRKPWRDQNAPHTDIAHNKHGYSCDFDATWGYNLRADLRARNDEYKMYAMSNFVDAREDMIATVTAIKP